MIDSGNIFWLVMGGIVGFALGVIVFQTTGNDMRELPTWLQRDPGWKFMKIETTWTNTIKGGTMTHTVNHP